MLFSCSLAEPLLVSKTPRCLPSSSRALTLSWSLISVPYWPSLMEATAFFFSSGTSSVGVSRTRPLWVMVAKSVPLAKAMAASSSSTRSWVISSLPRSFAWRFWISAET